MPASKKAAARAAFDRGGLPELVKAGRRHLAAVIYPGQLPQPSKPKAAQAPAKPSAATVSHAAALAWFEGRRALYERHAAALAPYVDPAGVMFDVGANIGYFTKILAETTGFRGTAHLFEPIPHLADLCRQTLAGVPYSTAVHQFGLSDKDETLDIFIGTDGNLGWNTLVAERGRAGTPLPIQVRAFDTAGIDATPAFVKIDVEGAEYKVLGGMLAAIERWAPRPVIMCEVGWGQVHPAWQDELDVFAKLAELGYRSTDLAGDPLDVAGLTRTTDILFLPR